MKKNILYLHVGWSKTGTSAIQKQIHLQHQNFLDKGILYPKSLQWNDHSHHNFALSFKGNGVYQSSMSPAESLEALRNEMEMFAAENVLISSELSPFYFANPRFKIFVKQHFNKVKVLFTVRRQSDLLLSLFNQLVKDPNVRYSSSLFDLAIRNIGWLNYFQNIKRWADVVGPENICVFPYEKDIVSRFLFFFGIDLKKDENSHETVNPSLPTRVLAIVQKRGAQANDNAEFIKIQENILSIIKNVPIEYDKHILFSVQEQRSLDSHFKNSNNNLVKNFCPNLDLKFSEDYQPIRVIPANFDLEKIGAQMMAEKV